MLENQGNLTHLCTDVFGVFSITGKDASDFLHRQLSNEIRYLEDGQGVPTCFLNREGRILLYFTLFKQGQGYLALVVGTQKNEFFSLFDRVLFREEVIIKEISPGQDCLLLFGSEATPWVLDQFGIPSSPQGLSHHLVSALDEPGENHLFILDWLLEPCYVLALQDAQVMEKVSKRLPLNAHQGDLERFHTTRIEKGTPFPECEVDGSMIPYECGLEGAISLTKGCYVGQEIIARIHNLGQSPRLLRGLIIPTSTVPKRGTPVLAGEIEVGKILSSGWSERLKKTIATTSIRTKYSQPGTTVTVAGNQATISIFPL
jgi:folate-binding protein YgfZ